MRRLLLPVAVLIVGCVASDATTADESKPPCIQEPTSPTKPDLDAPSQPPRFIVHNATGISLVLVEPGSFAWRGTPSPDNIYTVKVQRAFYIGVCEVTQAQWSRVMDQNPSKHRHRDNPVENIPRSAVWVFLRKTGLRLPDLGEWGLVATSAAAPRSKTDPALPQAWNKDNSDGSPQPVRRTLPNILGVYDVLGNVAEMVKETDHGPISAGGGLMPKSASTT